MKGQRTFSPAQDREIMRLLTELRNVDRPAQKAIRKTLRENFNFYITDFMRSRKGFSVGNYLLLKKDGEITVK